MIEIITDKERNLKNLKQIGTPKEEDKIYVENLAYTKIREESYKDKRVYVLMGHSERMQGKYATFVEAAIPISEVEFVGNVPRINNSVWSEVFREIRRLYEDMIIVGWAIDIKGMLPKMTVDLERVHREHFGGVHQVLFLMDTLEQEETFYVYKENKLVSKDGFYIYYHSRRNTNLENDKQELIQIKPMEPKSRTYEREQSVEIDLDIKEPETVNRGKYRQLMQEQQQEKRSDNGNMGLAIAVAMLVFVIGVGAYENRDFFFKESETVETNLLQESSTEVDAKSEEEMLETEATETAGEGIIPVETIDGTQDESEETEESEE